MLSPAHIDQILGIVQAGLGADAVWLFGSEASNRATATSDIDLAALFTRPSTPIQVLALRQSLEEAMGRPVDLVDSDDAGPGLKAEVLTHGFLLVDKAPARRIAMATQLPSELEDLQIVQAPIIKSMIQRMKNA